MYVRPKDVEKPIIKRLKELVTEYQGAGVDTSSGMGKGLRKLAQRKGR